MPRDKLRRAPGPDHIPGIYNYCDRWCERCPATRLCFLHESERERRAEHLREGRDPDDWEVVLEDVRRNFEEALGLLQEMAEEEGIDQEESEESPEEEECVLDDRGDNHPLVVESHNYMQAAKSFLKHLHEGLLEDTEEALELVEILPQDRVVGQLERLRDSYEVIAWYHALVPVKLRRAITSFNRSSGNEETSPEDHRRSDATGSAKVASESLMKSMAAFKVVYESMPDLKDEALNLLVMAKRLSDGVDQTFPCHREFYRPGLDGPYVPEEAEE